MALPNPQVVLSEDDHQHPGKKRRRPSPPPLINIRIPTSLESGKNEEEEEDGEGGLKTPKSAIHRIPSEMPQCPPAPRKPKSLPSNKRRAPRPVLLLDLTKDIDSWFPTPFLLHVAAPFKKFNTNSSI